MSAPEHRPSYGDQRRKWNDAFVEYMYAIVNHPTYSSMPCTTDDAGKIDWTIPSNRTRGSKNWDGNQRRREWWRERADELGIPIEGHWISATAKRLHPFGHKPCQVCGRVMFLKYVYPTRATLSALELQIGGAFDIRGGGHATIEDLADTLALELGVSEAIRIFQSVFPLIKNPTTLNQMKERLRNEYVEKESRKLSPGAMSNAPDRLDGFHTYNLCCRSSEDRGRASTNMVTYTVDRRAYEQWSEGDWSLADLVMASVGEGECLNCAEIGKLTADHVGPISLGFAHSPYFRPLCRRCNSAKNNRMTASDVMDLMRLEESGAKVASWQILYLWDNCKTLVSSDNDALLLSKLLRILQHHYLEGLGRALQVGVGDLLMQFLQPHYAYKRLKLVGFDSAKLTFYRIDVENRQDIYAKSRAARMARIAFDSLVAYNRREHRNIQVVSEEMVSVEAKAYEKTLQSLKSMKSDLRDHLVGVLSLDAAANLRDEQFEKILNVSAPVEQNRELRDSLGVLIRAQADVLIARFRRGEAVSWDDFAEN